MSLRSLTILLLALSFVSCASAPPAAVPPKPVVPEAAKVQTIDLLCNEKARYVSFDKLSVPVGANPVDVALTRDSIWVLFPERLVQIGRVAIDHRPVGRLQRRGLVAGDRHDAAAPAARDVTHHGRWQSVASSGDQAGTLMRIGGLRAGTKYAFTVTALHQRVVGGTSRIVRARSRR